MTLVIGIFGCAALFVVFGLIGGGHEQHERTPTCGTCDSEEDTADCGACHIASEISEHSHA
jgi:hypothetical protein